ncbi:hypothetical protein FQN54_002784 [Arachnomyces sp. PD_36]|nr:hypothetical protein FQN54_002784 [Arachnomyces sp. PD_36]
MSSTDEKAPTSYEGQPAEESAAHPSRTEVSGAPWMYKSPKIGPLTLPWYASPTSQLLLISFVCFLCPGMFNAVQGLGNGGQVDPTDVSNANTALYSFFAVVGFIAGSIANTIGLRLTAGIGGFGYFLYVAALLSYNHNQNAGFLIFTGALLGFCASLLWTAQGTVMMSYPDEKSKGKFISYFWIIFNMGAVIGSLINLGQNLYTTVDHVPDGTYIAFMVLQFFGAILAAFMVNSNKVRREDGSHVIAMKNPTWKTEIVGLYETLRSDFYIVALFPMFLASNWFTTYQFNAVNAANFDIPTRSLNNVLYWISQMIGAYIFGNLLDISRIPRSVRAKAVWVVMLAFTMAVWGGGYSFQKTFERSEEPGTKHFTDSGYIGPMFLYIFYGIYDAAFQTCVYWFMGSLTNNSRKLANFAGFYKGIQSAGAAITWRIDAIGTAYMTQFAAAWGLLAGSLILAAPIVFFKIKDSTSLEEDLKFSDETIEDVAPDAVLEESGVGATTTTAAEAEKK